LDPTVAGAGVTANSSVGAAWAASRPSSSASRIFLWIALIILLVAELVALTLPFNPAAAGDLAGKSFWADALYAGERGIRPTFITALAAAVLFSWPVLQQEFRRILEETPSRIISARWLSAHLVFLSLLIVGTRTQTIRLTSVEDWEGWLFLWMAVAFAALATWLFSVLPPRFWIRWLSRSRSALIIGGVAGLVAYALGNWTQDLWWPLQRASFQMVAMILELFGQAAVNRPDDLVIGTSRFAVIIGAHCSGLEGVGLMCAFVGIYLWSCRHELSFPQALLLLPIGAVSIWVLNSVRIAALIFIGGWNQEVALKGFHSAAGWIFFNFVAVGLVWTSSQSQLFAKTAERQSGANGASGYLLPLIVFFASSLVARVFSLGYEFFIPAVTIPLVATLWFSRATLLSLRWDPSWASLAAGGLVCAIIWMTSGKASSDFSTVRALGQMPSAVSAALLFACFIGSAIAIPIAQELAFRGYLARKLVAADFEKVRFDRFTWQSFLGSSILFGLTEPNWLPAILAGAIFALVMYRRGLLSDAILAHASSQGLLFILAAATGKWSLLS